MLLPRRRRPVVLRYEPVLGTLLEVQVTVGGPRATRRAHDVGDHLVAALHRLEAVFSVHGPDSELQRWRRGPQDGSPERLSPELHALLADSLRWQEMTGGAYNPATGSATARWQRAALEGAPPSDDELDELSRQIAEPRYRVLDDGTIQRTGDCSSLTFDAFAKGRCIDLAVASVLDAHHVRRLVVNLGGDLVHRGDGSLEVGIENPARPYDNEPPLALVALRDRGLATSGSARRGVEVAGTWHSHVIDPRTARPVDTVASATAVARDAATADVLATVLSVLPAQESLALVRRIGDDPMLAGDEGVACCVVGSDGRIVTDAGWDALAAQRVVR